MFHRSFRKAAACVCAVLGPAIVIGLPGAARAGADDELIEKSDIRPHWRESWSGAGVTDFGWSAYSGLTISPLGGIQDDGLRLRIVGGYGRYRYRGTRWNGTQNQAVDYRGTGAFTDILVGYHKALGPLTVKAFAGAATDAQLIVPLDPGNAVQGRATGAKAALETWLNLSDNIWLAADASWSDAHSAYGGNARLGYRVSSAFSAGLEAATFGNEEGEGGRSGVFARYEWESGELSASGGITGRIWDDMGKGAAAYGSVNWVRRF